MSYEKTNWVTGDIVTADKLNNLEKGVEDAQLPAYTSSDIGKVLTVGEGTETLQKVIVPEQTVTTELDDNSQRYLAIIHIDDKSQPSENYTYTMSVNGVSYTCDTDVGYRANNQYLIAPKLGTEDFVFMDPLATSSATYTISLTKSVPSVEPKWEAVGQNLVYYHTDGSYYFDGLSVGEAYEMFQKGKIPYVVTDVPGFRMLTKITESNNLFAVYYNFEAAPSATNLQATGKLPYASGT